MGVIRVADRCPYPGGRYISDGPFSGEAFRDEILLPALLASIATGQRLQVVLDGVPGYGSSFLEEAFGGLVRSGELGPNDVLSGLTVVAESPLFSTYKALADRYIKDAIVHARVAA